MRLATILTLILGISIFLFYYFTGYRSAFEADQQCHYEIREKYRNLTSLGCDHDLETRQWLLFEEGINSQPSKVIARFRY